MRNYQAGWFRGGFVFLQALVVILTMLTGLLGQADRARISGIVTDETQAVIPGVDVTHGTQHRYRRANQCEYQ
jgi:hypothetical protein